MPAAIVDIRVRELRIPFKEAFRHASAERSSTSTLWATVRTAHGVGYGESCPRPYVTGETVESAAAFCETHASALSRSVTGIESLREWMDAHREEIDAQPAAWCALELALLDAFAKEASVSVETFLALPPLAGTFRYTAVLGDSEPKAFAAMAERYTRHGFSDFKIKLSGDLQRDRQKSDVLRSLGPEPVRVRADANNLWAHDDGASTAIRFFEALDAPFWAIEEPIGARRYADLARVGAALDCRIILDESLARAGQVQELAVAPADRWVINVRVSKMGGLLRSLETVRAARAAGHGIIVGAQVGETSVLTRAALTVAQSAGDALLGQEGAFGTELLQRDVVDESLMFGRAGELDVGASGVSGNGFGLAIRSV